jgi:4-hydroxybenzoate polyprenyltransferase
VVFVIVYDSWAKRRRFLGPPTMAACRGLNLLLGVAAVPSQLGHAWPLGSISFTYIFAVTALSRGEVHGGTRRVAALALACLTGVLVVLLGLAIRSDGQPLVAVAVVALLGWRVWPPFWRAFRAGQPGLIRQAIRAGVLSLVVLDAALAAIYAGMLSSLAVLALGVLAAVLARLFAVT